MNKLKNAYLCQEILKRINNIDDNELKKLIMELIQNQAELTDDVLIDPLTKIYNRRILNHINDYNVIVMCDIDNFKQINDHYGHTVGDEIIKYVAKVLSLNTRQYDFVCRYGGDEFLIIFTNCSEEIVINRMQNVQAQLADNDIISGRLTISVGIAEKQDDDNLQLSIDKADKALYYSKLSGKDTITVNGNGKKLIKK